MQATDSLDHAREVAHDLAASARAHLDDLDLDPEGKKHLREFTRFVVERDV